MKKACLLPLLLLLMASPLMALAVEPTPDALLVTKAEIAPGPEVAPVALAPSLAALPVPGTEEPGGLVPPPGGVETVTGSLQGTAPATAGSQTVVPPIAEVAPEKLHVSKLEAPGSQLVPPPVVADRQLEAQRSGFIEFARSRVNEINKNHILSRDRMQIKKGSDGLYRALFHEVDDQSLSIQLSRSTSRGIPYVAVLSYKELVYTATCATPEACRQGPFQPTEVIPNRHIFVYNGGSWQ